jgi:hypothetical protein
MPPSSTTRRRFAARNQLPRDAAEKRKEEGTHNNPHQAHLERLRHLFSIQADALHCLAARDNEALLSNTKNMSEEHMRKNETCEMLRALWRR